MASAAYVEGAGAFFLDSSGFNDYALDSNGLPQYWALRYGVDCGDSTFDDGDALDCAAEYALGTSPSNADTDGDGLLDGEDPDPLDPLLP